MPRIGSSSRSSSRSPRTGATITMRTATTTSRAMKSQRSQSSERRRSSQAPIHEPTMPPIATKSAASRSISPFAKYVIDPAMAAGMIAASEVADARRWSMPANVMSRGTMRMPPPTPNAPDSSPPAAPIERESHPPGSARRSGGCGGGGHPPNCTGARRLDGVRLLGQRASRRPARSDEPLGGQEVVERSGRVELVRRAERGERRLASRRRGTRGCEPCTDATAADRRTMRADEHEQHAEHGAARVHDEVARVGDAIGLGHLHEFDEGREGESGDERERPACGAG